MTPVSAHSRTTRDRPSIGDPYESSHRRRHYLPSVEDRYPANQREGDAPPHSATQVRALPVPLEEVFGFQDVVPTEIHQGEVGVRAGLYSPFLGEPEPAGLQRTAEYTVQCNIIVRVGGQRTVQR